MLESAEVAVKVSVLQLFHNSEFELYLYSPDNMHVREGDYAL